MSTPIAFVTTRYRCPHCRRAYAQKASAERHLARCFANPAVRSCKTCRHALGPSEGYVWECAQGVDLSEEQCPTCGQLVSPEPRFNCECDISRTIRDMTVQCDLWEQR